MNHLRKIILSFLILISCLISAAPVFAVSDYDIENYHVDIVVGEDNVLSVTEKINVNFNSLRHGIKRNIPTISKEIREKNGKRYKKNRVMKLDNISVNNKFKVSSELDKKTITIGDPDLYADDHEEYLIKYTYDMGDDGIADYDDLYYNIIGNEWDTSIKNASFKITMPKDFDTKYINFSSGRYGSKGGDVTYDVKDNVISGKLNESLQAYEGLTIRVELPEGYFNVKTGGLNQLSTFIIIGICILFGLFCTAVFMKHGRDDIIYETIEFYPPENMTPSEVGYIAAGTSTGKQITALLVYWASKGYMKIKQLSTSDNIEFEKVKDLDNPKPFEKIVFRGLFSGRKTVTLDTLKYSFHEYIYEARKLLAEEFKSEDKRLSSKTSINWQVGLSVFAIILNFAIYFYLTYTTLYNMLIAVIAAVALTTLTSLYFITMVVMISRSHHVMKSSRKALLAFFTLLFAALNIGVAIILSSLGTSWLALMVLAVITASTSITIGLTYKRSEYCNKMLGKILGFKDFLEKAEKEKLEALVNENPEYFYNIMPYTYVLDISDEWMKKFEDIAMPQPDWYTSQGNTAYPNYMFYNTMFDSMDRMERDMTAVEWDTGDSGGFGGGGFSGGGGGGGGGSSW